MVASFQVPHVRRCVWGGRFWATDSLKNQIGADAADAVCACLWAEQEWRHGFSHAASPGGRRSRQPGNSHRHRTARAKTRDPVPGAAPEPQRAVAQAPVAVQQQLDGARELARQPGQPAAVLPRAHRLMAASPVPCPATAPGTSRWHGRPPGSPDPHLEPPPAELPTHAVQSCAAHGLHTNRRHAVHCAWTGAPPQQWSPRKHKSGCTALRACTPDGSTGAPGAPQIVCRPREVARFSGPHGADGAVRARRDHPRCRTSRHGPWRSPGIPI